MVGNLWQIIRNRLAWSLKSTCISPSFGLKHCLQKITIKKQTVYLCELIYQQLIKWVGQITLYEMWEQHRFWRLISAQLCGRELWDYFHHGNLLWCKPGLPPVSHPPPCQRTGLLAQPEMRRGLVKLFLSQENIKKSPAMRILESQPEG